MMSRQSFLSAMVALFVVSIASQALAIQLASSSFNHQFNGDVLNAGPNHIPNYTTNTQPTVGPTTDGDIMSYDGEPSTPRYVSDDWSVVSATGFSLEYRIKIIDNAREEGVGGTFLVRFGTGSAGDIIGVGANFVKVADAAITVGTFDNTDGFHTFRITQEEDGGGPGNPTINLYRDTVLIYTLANGGNSSANILYWGGTVAGTAGGGGAVDMDYFRWDNTGAFEPAEIPEPTSLSLLALAGLACLRRRK